MHTILYKLSDEERSTLDENLGEDESEQGDVVNELFSDYDIVMKKVSL